MKQLLTFGAAVAFAIAMMNFPQIVKTLLGLTVVKGGAAFAADLGPPPPPPYVGKGKAPVVGKGKAPIIARG
jgi:ABC-type xylose transport system permease subunit